MRIITIDAEKKQISAQNINPNELNYFVDSFVQGTSIRLMIDGNNHCMFVNSFSDLANKEKINAFIFIDNMLQQPIFGNAVIVQFNGDYVDCELEISKIENYVIFLTESQADNAYTYYYYL